MKRGGGAEKVLAILKGGGGAQTVLGYILRGSMKFWHIVGGRVKFPLFKRGGAKSLTLS